MNVTYVRIVREASSVYYELGNCARTLILIRMTSIKSASSLTLAFQTISVGG